MVLAALYESWTSPFAVVLVVPMALVGVLLALMMPGFDNNLYTQVGLILMIGLACKNAILIVEFARQLQAEGMSATEAAVEATRRRFRPIIMTSFAFILGVVPLPRCLRSRSGQSTGHRYGGFWRHAVFNTVGHTFHAGALRHNTTIGNLDYEAK